MAEAPQQSAPKSRKEMRQERRVARLEKRQDIQRKKGEQALSEGRTMDAKQKRYRYNRLQERIDRNKNK
jgi:DNA polymerase II small subunit/DNA polymerase delta subunit B